MKELRVKLIERIKRTPSVESFRFIPPEKIDFIPGQFLQVIFDEINKRNEELNKYLSLSCSPTKEYIEITKRISQSSFSQRLLQLKPRDEVLIKVPLGGCVFQEDYKKIAFLIGGIGITPVISILEYIVAKKLWTEAVLFYSNRSDNDIAFREELDSWQETNKNIKVFYTVTECRSQDKACPFGYIDKKLLSEKACNFKDTIIYIFGPPQMVEAMHNLASKLECKKENIKTEKFIGY